MQSSSSSINAELTYLYSAEEKWKFFLPCARQKFFPRRHLFAGPYAGEFGYELMQWQGFVRARRAAYEQVHVLTYPGRDYLYEGCQVHHHDIDFKRAPAIGMGVLGRRKCGGWRMPKPRKSG